MILADKITVLRKKNGWSQEELADKMNVSRQSVSKWEGAQSTPDLERILQLGRLFGVSTDYLLKDELEETEYLAGDADIPEQRRISMAEAGEFLEIKRLTAKRIALAVFLCILAPMALMLLAAVSERVPAVSEELAAGGGLITLLLFVAAAVAIFVSCGSKTRKFEYLEKEDFETEYGVTGMVKERQKQYRDTYTRSNILGSCICILSAVPLFCSIFLSKNDIATIAMLCVTMVLAGIGTMLFITAGIIWASMEKLLQEGDYTKQKKHRSPLAGAIGTAYWLIVVAAYLVYSFSTERWDSSWIIWPVAGVLYGAVTIVCGALSERKK